MDIDFSKYQNVQYIEFDQFIIKNLYDEYISLTSRKEYLALPSGIPRRSLIYINSKRKKFGNSFVFSLNELASILGIEDSESRRKKIGTTLKTIQNELQTIKYTIKKKSGIADWDVLINFEENGKLIESSNSSSNFYQNLVSDYGRSKLESLDVRDIDIENMVKEFNNKYTRDVGKDSYIYNKEEMNPAEFCIDVTLFQVIHCGYTLTKTFKALAKIILVAMINGSLELPEKYRYFVTKRIKMVEKRKTDEKIRYELEKSEAQALVEQKKLDSSFSQMYSAMIENNKSFKQSLKKRAIVALAEEGTEEGDMMFNISLDYKMESLAKKDFMNGDLIK